MSFRDMMDDDAANIFLNADEYAEPITYVSKASDRVAGTEYTRNALVDRNPLQPDNEGGRSFEKAIEVVIANDSGNGITSVNAGFDRVRAPENIGKDAVDWRVVEVIRHDDALWHLKCTM